MREDECLELGERRDAGGDLGQAAVARVEDCDRARVNVTLQGRNKFEGTDAPKRVWSWSTPAHAAGSVAVSVYAPGGEGVARHVEPGEGRSGMLGEGDARQGAVAEVELGDAGEVGGCGRRGEVLAGEIELCGLRLGLWRGLGPVGKTSAASSRLIVGRVAVERSRRTARMR